MFLEDKITRNAQVKIGKEILPAQVFTKNFPRIASSNPTE